MTSSLIGLMHLHGHSRTLSARVHRKVALSARLGARVWLVVWIVVGVATFLIWMWLETFKYRGFRDRVVEV